MYAKIKNCTPPYFKKKPLTSVNQLRMFKLKKVKSQSSKQENTANSLKR
jgi:hypothetical protein